MAKDKFGKSISILKVTIGMVLGLVIFNVGKSIYHQIELKLTTYTIPFEMNEIYGINSGEEVRISGVRCGVVDEARIDQNGIRGNLRLRNECIVSDGSVGFIEEDKSILGSGYKVEIKLSNKSNTADSIILKPGATNKIDIETTLQNILGVQKIKKSMDSLRLVIEAFKNKDNGLSADTVGNTR